MKIKNILSVLVLITGTLFNNNMNAGCNAKDGTRTGIQATIKAQVKDSSGNWIDTEYVPVNIEVKWVCEVSATDPGKQLQNITYKWSGGGTSGTTKECKITYSAIGENKPKCEVTALAWKSEKCELTGSSAPLGKATVFKVTGMNKLSFSGGYTLVSDDGATTYSAPHWTGNPNPLSPIAFRRNTKFSVEIEMELSASVSSNSGVNVLIKGDGVFGQNIPPTEGTLSGSKLILPKTSATTAFPDHIDYYKDFTLVWKVSYDHGASWIEINTTFNECYITREVPSCAVNFHTLFHIGCKNAKGKSNVLDVIEAVWGEFADREVENYSGTQLTYYRPPIDPLSTKDHEFTTSGLLKDHTGRCKAWTDFFVEICKSQGINSLSQKNIIHIDHPTYSFNSLLIQPIPAQGNPTPWRYFKNHAVVCWHTHDKIYDPSYGETHINLAAWEDMSLIAVQYKIDDNTAYNVYNVSTPSLETKFEQGN